MTLFICILRENILSLQSNNNKNNNYEKIIFFYSISPTDGYGICIMHR